MTPTLKPTGPHSLAYLASRVFGMPLMMNRGKLEVILHVLGPRLGIEPTAAPMMPMDDESDDTPAFPGEMPEGIAVIDVIGPLVKRECGNALSGGPTSYAEIEEQYLDALTNPSVKGILFNIDSPGGEVGGCFDLADLIYSRRGDKPCYAVANDDAFSAAYALASACEKVFVSSVGGCGSVGVVALHVDQSGFDQKVGLKYTYIHAGDRKVDLNPHEPLTPESAASLQAEIDRLYDMFAGAVARNRRMSLDAVRATQAGIFCGPAAVQIGFADQVGNLQDALAALAARVNQTGMGAFRASVPEIGVEMNNETIPVSAETETPAEEPVEQPVAVEPEPTTEEPAAEVPVIEPEAVPEVPKIDATAEALEYAAEVADWCKIAKRAGMASDFIRRKATIADVRKELLNRLADASDANPIDSHAPMGAPEGIEAINQKATQLAKERGIDLVSARIEVAKANPELYAQYQKSLASSQQIRK